MNHAGNNNGQNGFIGYARSEKLEMLHIGRNRMIGIVRHSKLISAELAKINRVGQNRQSQPESADSAEIGRVGRNRQSRPKSAVSCRNLINSHVQSAVSAEIGSICQNRQYLPKSADSAETGRLCQNWHSQWETNSMGHKPSKKRPNVFVILIPHPQCKFINTSHWLKHETTKETMVW